MKNRYYFSCFFVCCLFFAACNSSANKTAQPITIAFLSDVHLQDIYGEFLESDFVGVKNPKTERYNTIRTMEAQLRSTRLFNENYFAFIAALEDIVAKKIKLVVLPGDFSDDGQPMNIKALRKILNEYSETYDITFLVITGNHDPVRPFSIPAKKNDFLGEGGKEQVIMSKPSMVVVDDTLTQHKPIVDQAIQQWGYLEIFSELRAFGLYPNKEFTYWNTPFTNYTYKDYNLDKAKQFGDLDNRKYTIPNSNISLPDMSYVIQVGEHVWLAGIDANVYLPKSVNVDSKSDEQEFLGASIGYNLLLENKGYLLKWIEEIALEAHENNKTLISFSHYPMLEYFDDAGKEMVALFGKDNMQLNRVPREEVGTQFADAGLQVHIGGHMHLNDTGMKKTKAGNVLFNVQVPSLAAYPAAYKILTVTQDSYIDVETVILDTVPNFKELFSMYEQEHAYLKNNNPDGLWNKDILYAKTYQAYSQEHLKELIRLRFLPEDWPKELTDLILEKNGKEIAQMAMTTSSVTLEALTGNEEFTIVDLKQWSGFDMIYDFYRLRNADQLAIIDIGEARIAQYSFVCGLLEKTNDKNLVLWAKIFQKFMNGLPSDNFRIDLKRKAIY
ncbi:metallophosphoesterase family protein [Spongiimicrobium sp. 3-5]|uniref:metallophosphoesterase family protein n=1 Tax=Spongiimicrobium sp. 3-5 TaxID=3332596 RepID=UPI00397FC6E1